MIRKRQGEKKKDFLKRAILAYMEQSGEIGFIVELEKDDVEYFKDNYERYITTCCDLNQEDGGSYL